MKFVTYHMNNQAKPGILIGSMVYDIYTRFASIKHAIQADNRSLQSLHQEAQAKSFPYVGEIETLPLKPPICYPNKLLCVAGNYIDHIKEGGRTYQKRDRQAPWIFCVPPTTVMIGSGEPVQLHPQAKQIDYEGELAIVIGKQAKTIQADQASTYIAGYTIFNDVTERSPYMIEGIENPRDLSFWYKKSFDTFGPTGPYLVTADEIPDPQDLLIEVFVNQEKRQVCRTSEMIFSVYELVSFLSGFLTLEPGDIIATGTPAGVGYATGKYLSSGDEVHIRIEGLGDLINKVV